MRKKILIINTSFRYEGPNDVLNYLAHSVDVTRFEIVFACMHEGGPMEEIFRNAGFQTHNFGMEGFWDLSVILRVRDFIRREGVDLVMVQLLRAEVFGGCGAWLAGVPLLLVAHNIDPYRSSPRHFPHYFLSRLAILWPRKIVAVSDFVRSYVIKHQKVDEERIETIRCSAVDIERYRALAPERESARAEFNIGRDEMLIGTVARLDQQKGLFFLLEAFKTLNKNHENLRLVLVGDGPQREALQRWVKKEGFENRILFAGFRRDFERILQGFDIFALPSLWEGLPMTLVGAMASGKPIATTNVAGIPEVIRHDFNGLLTRPGDSVAFADILERLLRDETLRDRLGANARDFAAKNCTPELMARQYEKAWTEILETNV